LLVVAETLADVRPRGILARILVLSRGVMSPAWDSARS
jgi:hypothetical protein